MTLRTVFAALVLATTPAMAQPMPAIPSTAIKPDPTHATFLLPQDLKWKKESLGQLQAPLYGDPGKPGPYGILIKWPKGQMSHPHFHTTDRFAYVVQGTWWISTSDHRDPKTTWPLPQGSFATDLAGKVHWDGSKDEDLVLPSHRHGSYEDRYGAGEIAPATGSQMGILGRRETPQK